MRKFLKLIRLIVSCYYPKKNQDSFLNLEKEGHDFKLYHISNLGNKICFLVSNQSNVKGQIFDIKINSVDLAKSGIIDEKKLKSLLLAKTKTL